MGLIGDTKNSAAEKLRSFCTIEAGSGQDLTGVSVADALEGPSKLHRKQTHGEYNRGDIRHRLGEIDGKGFVFEKKREIRNSFGFRVVP